MHYVVLSGNIGTGKTTAIKTFGALFPNARAFCERKGMYLERYYKDSSFAFLNQLDYTIQFLEQAATISGIRDASWVLQDRSIYDTHGVFSRSFLEAGRMDDEQFRLLSRLYAVAKEMRPPTLLVLLEAAPEVCYSRMMSRGDPEERCVEIPYLKILDDAHRRWFEEFDVCPKMKISTDSVDPESIVATIIRSVERHKI